MANDGRSLEGQGSIASLFKKLEHGVMGERPYAPEIKQAWRTMALAAGWHEKENGYFVSNHGTQVLLNKVAKHPQTGIPLINPETDRRMIPDLVIMTKRTITVIDPVWKGSERHLKKTEGYITALREAWNIPPLGAETGCWG